VERFKSFQKEKEAYLNERLRKRKVADIKRDKKLSENKEKRLRIEERTEKRYEEITGQKYKMPLIREIKYSS
jgi:hypothetical protein